MAQDKDPHAKGRGRGPDDPYGGSDPGLDPPKPPSIPDVPLPDARPPAPGPQPSAAAAAAAAATDPTMPDDVLDRITEGRSIRLDIFRPPTRARPINLLTVEPPRGEIDGFVVDAASDTSNEFGGQEKVDAVTAHLLETGRTEQVARLTERLNRSALDRVPRLLLSLPGVYATIVEGAIERNLPLDDTTGLFSYVLRRLEDKQGGARVVFTEFVVDLALKSKRMRISARKRELVVEALRNAEMPLKASKALALVLRAVEAVGSKAIARAAVEWYAERGEIDPRRFTEAVKRAMTDYLAGLGVLFDTEEFESGKFDEYLAIAYNHAVRGTNGGSADPIDVVRRRGAVVDWDFRVETFDGVEEQGVVPDNVRAAGALDYLYQLGDRMGIFRLLDAFTLEWARGGFDLEHVPFSPQNTEDVQALLFRYHKLRNERVSPEERAMLYRRVLDKGSGKLLSGTHANRPFTALWTKLMSEVADHIRRSEESPGKAVSRQRIYEAMRQLQINLSERMAGMARLQVTEMYHQFLEAKAILESEQMLNYYGAGPRRSIWLVIERGKRELLGEQDNLSALLTAAVEGNRIFQLVADFDPATFTDGQFQELADACEAVIIAESVLSDTPRDGPGEADDEDDWDDDEDEDDGFDDWDD